MLDLVIDFVQINTNKTTVIVKNIEKVKEEFQFDYIFEGPIEAKLDKLNSKT